MTIFELASEVETLSFKIERTKDLLSLLHEGLFTDVLDEDWKREAFCNRLHYYDALLCATTDIVEQTEKEACELSEVLYAIDRVQKQAVKMSAQTDVAAEMDRGEAVAV